MKLLLALLLLAGCDTLLPPTECGVTSPPAAQGAGYCTYPSP